MKFRPCIDIHNGSVKQIVGGSLTDQNDHALENFVSNYDAAYYASMYKKDHLEGGHIIILNAKDSPYYEADLVQAKAALKEFPQGLMIGGGITDENALEFIEAGASHVIVTSFVFKDGKIHWDRLKSLSEKVGKEHLVIDLSCRKKDNAYYVVTDRWQKFTELQVTTETLDLLSPYCSEFLIHAVDVEGKASGIEKDLVNILSQWKKCPMTYAGGISSYEDLKILDQCADGHIDFTIGSALDLFGGHIKYLSLI